MKILFIAPVPPPVTGNSLPIKVLFDDLKDQHDITIINLNKESHSAGITSFSRIVKILKVLYSVYREIGKNQKVYLTVAESGAGNFRDICIYFLCRHKLDNLVIHMLGGASMKKILAPNESIFFKANRYFLSKIEGAVVEGQDQFNTFANVMNPNKIHIVNNFAEDFLFISDEKYNEKHQKGGKLRILFLSNFLFGKGHFELLEAFQALPKDIRAGYEIDFAGKIVSEDDRIKFQKMMNNADDIKYHGSVSGDIKRELYHRAHIFCLPTYYPYEGQPFTIVEGYAAGLYVMTTYHSGIPHIFTDKVNGTRVEGKSVQNLIDVFSTLDRMQIEKIGRSNMYNARIHYTQKSYINKMKKVFRF